MRVREEYKRAGYFWLPNNKERKIPGTLIISDGGKILLEVVGLFDDSIIAFSEDSELGRINGHVEKDGLVTLDKCYYKSKNFAVGGISKSTVHASIVYSGVAYDKDEAITFNTVRFAVEGISEWVGISGINVFRSSDYRTATINYTPQDELVYELNNGINLHIIFGYTLPGSSNKKEAKITHQTYFKLSSEVPKELQEFRTIIHQLTYLLCFAIDATVSISNVSATSNEIKHIDLDDTSSLIDIELYYPSLPFSEVEPKIDLYRMLFQFSDIRENAEIVFKNWLNAYSLIRPSLGLYFSAVSGDHKYLDGRFLALAQALETYHRSTSDEVLMEETEFRSMIASILWNCPRENRKWLKGRIYYGNEISLGQRIKRIIEPYKSYLGSKKQRSKIIRGIVNTRNYLTHYSNALEKDSAKGKDLWYLCQKMEAIFQLHLLQQLGFKESDIKRMLTSSYRLQQKFDGN